METMKRICIGLSVLVMLHSSSLIAQAQEPQKVEYDTFCKMPDFDTRRSAFAAATPDNKAELAKTHVQRWRDANKTRLNRSQLDFLEEMLAALTPSNFGSVEGQRSILGLEDRLVVLFAVADIKGLQVGGTCIPKGTRPA